MAKWSYIARVPLVLSNFCNARYLLLVQSFILNLRLGFSAYHFLHNFFFFLTGLILRTLGPFNVFILLSGWICLHGVLD